MASFLDTGLERLRGARQQYAALANDTAANENFRRYLQMAQSGVDRLAGQGVDAKDWLAKHSKDVGITDYASFAASRTLAAGSAARAAAIDLAKQKVASEYGAEVFEMINALSECSARLSTELQVETAQFGIALALPLLHLHHDSLEAPAKSGQCLDLRLLKELKHWLIFASGAYGSADKALANDAKGSISAALAGHAEVKTACLPAAGVQLPGHFVAVDQEHRVVVLGVRGTSTLSDAVTDAVGDAVTSPLVPGVQFHKAMLASAVAVLERTRNDLTEALQANRGFSVLVTGHSLGAGTAIICSILLKASPLPGSPTIRCFAFAPPPVVAPVDAAPVRAVEIITLVNRFDAVPRASLANVFRLGQEAMAIDKLSLTLYERLALIRKAGRPELPEVAESRQQIIQTVSSARVRAGAHPKFPPLCVPGKVYWIEWPPAVDAGSAPAPNGIDGSCQTIWLIATEELQHLQLKGGAAALKDHLCSAYAEGIDGAIQDAMRKQHLCCSLCAVM
eukprot:CAMPEP_0117540780 /NCGR_PEP_ID=MMETSP0784-20121206/43675_1 /TAXON_ID=39447 /ORGANISM="" /LENGTH=508 /DNA_ID=CAMNT_0005337445 /DNA_START=43 /DNA_END=1569 /DNA_ORIENTATION=+